MTILEKWPRDKALKIRAIIERIGICGCGTDAHWVCILELLKESENHTVEGFYRDRWYEFGAKVLDGWDLLNHGTGIGRAWLTDDGKLLLEFLRDFGTEDASPNDHTGHPFWAVEFSWDTNPEDKDTYSEWAASLPQETAK